MTPEDKERIEREAKEAAEPLVFGMQRGAYCAGYIAGATFENERAQQELQAYRDRLREAIFVIEEIQNKWISQSHYWGSETNDHTEAFLLRARKLIDTVTPTSNPEQS